MKHTHTLTVLLSLHAPRLDGTPAADPPKTDDKKDELRLTPEEWAARERERASKLDTGALVNELVKVKGENYHLRQKAAPDGGLVLDAEQAKRWAAWEALGKPEEVGTALEQGKKDRAVVAQQEKRGQLTSVAEAAGWDADTFTELDGLAGGLEWRVQEIKDKEGESVKQVQVKQGDAWRGADEFAAERWKKFLPVLQAGESKADPEPTAQVQTTRVHTAGTGGGKGRPYTVEDAEKAKAESGQYSM